MDRRSGYWGGACVWETGWKRCIRWESSIIPLTAGFAAEQKHNTHWLHPSGGLGMTYMSEIGLSCLYPCQSMRPIVLGLQAIWGWSVERQFSHWKMLNHFWTLSQRPPVVYNRDIQHFLFFFFFFGVPGAPWAFGVTWPVCLVVKTPPNGRSLPKAEWLLLLKDTILVGCGDVCIVLIQSGVLHALYGQCASVQHHVVLYLHGVHAPESPLTCFCLW